MGLFSTLFGNGKSREPVKGSLKVDMHSHLLPGIDDGVDTFEESIEVIKGMYEMGYRKLITTPHIMSDFYRNEPDEIRKLTLQLREKLAEQGIDMQIECAAEYYLDEQFGEKIKDGSLMTFGNNYVLVETSYLEATPHFNTYIFDLKIAGYQPVLAHPERYTYLYKDFEMYRDVFARELLFQVNIFSLFGYYSRESKKMAEKLFEENMVHFLGTDIHHARHLVHLEKALGTSLYRKVEEANLLNNSLLS